MRGEELNDILKEYHKKLRNELDDILIMINMCNDIKLRISMPNKSFSSLETWNDCYSVKKSFPNLKDSLLEIEKEFINKIFFEYEKIHDNWLLYKYINDHILIYSAIIFKSEYHFNSFNFHYISGFFDSYPFKYEYHIKSGKELLEIYNYYRTNYKTEECKELSRKYTGVFCDNYKIKKTKWYIMREYHRHLLGRDNYDLGYMENVYNRGIKTLKETKKLLEEIDNFEPKHNITSSYICTSYYIELF